MDQIGGFCECVCNCLSQSRESAGLWVPRCSTESKERSSQKFYETLRKRSSGDPKPNRLIDSWTFDPLLSKPQNGVFSEFIKSCPVDDRAALRITVTFITSNQQLP